MNFKKIPASIRDLIVTGAVSVVILASILIVTRLLAQGLGPEKFGAYSLSRSIIRSIISFSILSMTVSLPRYIAFYSGDHHKQRTFLLLGTGSVMILTCLIIIVFCVGASRIAFLLFGAAGSPSLLYGTILLLAGHTMHMLVYSIYRGRLLMKYANLLQLVNIGFIPLAAVLAFSRTDASTILMIMGLATLAVVIVPFLWFFIPSLAQAKPFPRADTRELFAYSLPRIPADIGLGLMFVIGPWLASRFGDIRESGYFIIGLSVLNIIGSLLESVGLVTLPYFSRLSGKSDRDNLRTQILVLVNFTLNIGLFVGAQLFIFADWITVVWCGKEYAPAIPFMRIILASAGAFALYVSLRSAIDADDVKAINTKNIWIALFTAVIIGILLHYMGLKNLALAYGLSLGVLVLGILSVIYLHRRFTLKISDYQLPLLLFINIFLAGVALLIKRYLPANMTGLLLVLLMEGIFLLSYFMILRIRQTAWLGIIIKKISIKPLSEYES